MNTSQLIQAVNRLVDDELPSVDIVQWLNGGLNDLGAATQATFPQLDVTAMTDEPVIPAKYHEILVLYASARAKEQDSAVAEADRFMVQYEQKKKEFVSRYIIPDEYKDASESSTSEEYPPNPYSWWGAF